jgi:hypothetical protein
MSKRTKVQRQKTSSQALQKAVQGVVTLDAFQNFLARTGIGTTSLMEGSTYVMNRMTQNYNLLNAMYRGNWIVRRIIDVIPKAMCKNWLTYNADISPEELDKLKKLERQTSLKRSILKGLKLGRLYGGAAGLILLEGQEDQLGEPLDYDSIMPGDFKGLLIVDRWQGIFPQTELVSELGNPEIGLPEYYCFYNPASLQAPAEGNGSYRVHHSRVVRFTGDDLPNWEFQAESYWGASKMEAVFEELKKRDNTSANIAGLTFLANLRILKMDDLGQTLGLGNDAAQQQFQNTLSNQNALMSNFGMSVMGKDDDMTSLQYTFAGMAEIYETFKSDMAGACQMPVTKLFGTSPGGMNATGESDMENFADVIEEEQEEHLRPAMDKLLPVICMSAMGRIPDDIEYIFNPVRTIPDKVRAEIMKSESDIIFGASDRGLISNQVALKELKTMGEDTGMFSTLTDEIINAASDVIETLELTDPDDTPAKADG